MPIVDDGNRAPIHSRVERRRHRNADLHYVRGQRSKARPVGTAMSTLPTSAVGTLSRSPRAGRFGAVYGPSRGVRDLVIQFAFYGHPHGA